MDEITIVGVDLAKSVFQVHAANSDGRAVIRKRLPRTRFPVLYVTDQPLRGRDGSLRNLAPLGA